MTPHEIIAARDKLAEIRQPFEGLWRELSELYLPFRSVDSTGKPDLLMADEMFESSPRSAALTFANGLASLVMPRQEKWFEFQPPLQYRNNDEAVSWYRQASDTARAYIEVSNLYEEVQECLLDAGVFGTDILFIPGIDDSDGLLNFQHIPIGTVHIGESAHKKVNQVYRTIELTAEQAAEEFGEENLPTAISGKLGQPTAKTELFEFIHVVYRRKPKEINKNDPDALQMPWADEVIFTKSKEFVKRSGYEEFPFAVHRYRRFDRCPWGFGPGATALGDPRQLNFVSKIAEAGIEKAVFPPIMAPDTLEGEIGIGALEITYVDTSDPNTIAGLKEWATAGRIDYALTIMERKEAAINKAFHVDLFNFFTQRAAEKQPLTATESQLIAGEKLTQFSPIFSRLVSEQLTPMLTRVFGILFRRGAFGDPPEILQNPETGSGIASPGLSYQNKIMMALKAQQNLALVDYLNLLGGVSEMAPGAALILNPDQIARDTARNIMIPENWLRTEKEVEEINAALSEQQQQEHAIEQAERVAAAAGKMGVGNQVAESMQELM